MELVLNNSGVFITLKQITDLLSVEHNKAMKVVAKLAKEPSFGGVELLATPTYNPNGSFNRNIETYLLNKRQAIIVSAKLNDLLLMVVVDKVYELEEHNAKLLVETAKQQTQLLEMKLQEQTLLVTALELEHKQELISAVENAKKLNTYTIDNIDVISIRKYRQEHNPLHNEKFLWAAMEHSNMARTITRVTQFRRLPEHLIVTDGKTTNEHKTPLYTVEAIDRCVAAYLTHLASLERDKS